MPLISVPTKDNQTISLYVEDYGKGDPIILIHGWPLTHRAWEGQVAHLVEQGYRVISYDRRGFGQSDKPWSGYDYDTLAADLQGIITELNLSNVTLAGFSMGGGEVARYIGNYGTDTLSAAMLISAVTPFMLKTDDNPNGVDKSVFEGMIEGVKADRFAFIAEWSKNFMNYDDFEEGISDAFMDFLWQQTTFAAPQAMIGCIKAFGETDFRDDLKKFDIPTLIIHGGNDKICPAEICGEAAANYVPHATLEILKNAPHGLNVTHRNEVNERIASFKKEPMKMTG